MLVYFDVYNTVGNWVGCFDCEWLAEIVAAEYNGYYLMREETIAL